MHMFISGAEREPIPTPRKSKEIQVKKLGFSWNFIWISLDSLRRIETFQWVTAIPNKKILSFSFCDQISLTPALDTAAGASEDNNDDSDFQQPFVSGMSAANDMTGLRSPSVRQNRRF